MVRTQLLGHWVRELSESNNINVYEHARENLMQPCTKYPQVKLAKLTQILADKSVNPVVQLISPVRRR